MAWVISRFARCSSKPLTGFGFKREIELIPRFSQMMCAVILSIKAYSVASVSTRALTVFLLLLLNKMQGVTRGSEANESSARLEEDEINNEPLTATLVKAIRFLITQSHQVPEFMLHSELELLCCLSRWPIYVLSAYTENISLELIVAHVLQQ